MKQNIHHLYYLFYPRSWIIIVFALLINTAVSAQEQTPASNDFIIGASIFDTLQTNPGVFNSFINSGMNTLHQRADNDTKPLLTYYNLVAYNARSQEEYIYHYSTAYYSKWEAEQNLTGEDTARVGFKHKAGQPAFWYDQELNDSVLCWSTEGLSAPACSLMYGPHYRQEKKYKRWYSYSWADTIRYVVRFNMALTNPYNVAGNEDVCKIKVVFRYRVGSVPL